MSQSFETQGTIHSIGETTEYGQNGFTKREFVILMNGDGENPRYPNHVALELTKDKCALLDSHNIGDEISVTFNLSGRLWAGNGQGEKCFTSLQCWRIESVGASVAQNSFSPAPDQNAFSQTPDQNAYSQKPAQNVANTTFSNGNHDDDFGDIPF